ncbi:IclR family transcriptional regulator [Corticibacter populi]|uniref:IclR family transcriptional regulator n=1 Tax=Corticibacter populi TaxID=1550736 RepID=A0A3M6QS56_9BURK|nr:IclR family transcriptional regulator [Corticibacter populi]RMX05880.1 IclR family transcriptional regulator [Corticibacter populi]RZS30802.1 IclR family transcriptional regulator [Corticibacter populi]
MTHPPHSSKDLPQPGDSYVQSFARGLAVIRSFSAEAPQQTLSEVAARAGLTRAGARRILLTLQTLGYVATDGKLFRLTPRILDLGFAYLSSMPIWNLAEPFIGELVKQVHESSSIAVLDGTDAVYVMRVPTQKKIMRISLGVGSRLPAYCSSLGRVLLAGLPPEELRDVLRRSDIQPLTRQTATQLDEIEARIEAVRQQGWCLVDQELEEGLISMAAPILSQSGRVMAAINVSGQANRTSAEVMRETMLPALLQTARAISRTVSIS